MAERLEREVAVLEAFGSSTGEVDTKTFAHIKDLLTTSVSAGLSKDSISIHLIHTIRSQDETTLLTNALHVRTESRSAPTRCRSLISSRMTYSAVCCMSAKKASSYKLHMTSLSDMNKLSTIGSEMEVKPQ